MKSLIIACLLLSSCTVKTIFHNRHNKTVIEDEKYVVYKIIEYQDANIVEVYSIQYENYFYICTKKQLQVNDTLTLTINN